MPTCTTPTSDRIDTNDDDGNVLTAGVEQYRTADRLEPFGFSGWIGPEPHGRSLRYAGVRRDPLIADRVVAWLEDRYARRAVGDPDALRPFLLVASFVNPHDIVLFPAWARRGSPLEPSPLDPPNVPEAPTQHEDLATKPAAQIAFRDTYPSGYGPVRAVIGTYTKRAQEYRDLYHRLHAEVDAPLDRVRRAVTDQGSDAIIVKTSDHGDLLGAHGGLHQKWFNLYDEATRVPFSIALVGSNATTGAAINDAPTSHIDIMPTLLAAAGIDETAAADRLQEDFTEVHPLPGANLMPVVVDPTAADRDRAVYLMTNDNMLEGDTGASGVARRLKRTTKPPLPLRISTPAHVASNFEGLVHRLDGTLWKLVRVFDDPATWTEPGVRHLAASGGPGPDTYRSEPLPDQWELYDLDADPIEANNRWHDIDDDPAIADVFDRMRSVLNAERTRAVPERNHPWPYESRQPTAGPMTKTPPPPARALRKLVQKLGMHPDDPEATSFNLAGKRGLVVATNVAWLDIAKPTGVFASEMTVPYYAFLDAGMDVDLASPAGGMIAVDPKSLRPVVRTPEDDRFMADDDFRDKVAHSLAIGDLDMTSTTSFSSPAVGARHSTLASPKTWAQRSPKRTLLARSSAACATAPSGCSTRRPPTVRRSSPDARSRRSPTSRSRNSASKRHPTTPNASFVAQERLFESETKFRDPLANHWVVDGNLVTGQNQNAGPMVAREMMQILVDQDLHQTVSTP